MTEMDAKLNAIRIYFRERQSWCNEQAQRNDLGFLSRAMYAAKAEALGEAGLYVQHVKERLEHAV